MTGPVLFLIPARGGSRRVPGKNATLVGGIPLLGWAVRLGRLAARGLGGGPHRVVCSTDDAGLAALAAAWGGEVLERPAALATDDATSVDVAIDALDRLASEVLFGTLVLLQPTSPLSDPADVVGAVERHWATGASVTTVAATHPATWRYSATGPDAPSDPGTPALGVLRVADGQSGGVDRGAWVLTGAVYVIDPTSLRRERRFVTAGSTIGWEVPAERAVDIDTPTDVRIAEGLLATRAVAPVPIGRHRIGDGPVFLIAEGGVNHDGDVDIAHRLVDAAAEAGADAIKFQTFDPDALAASGAPLAAYQADTESGAAAQSSDQREMLRRLALPAAAWFGLQQHAHELGLAFLSTPFDDGSADLLDRLGVPAFKVGSGDLTDIPFLERLARRGRPMLVSTGMATMAEVATAVDAIAASGAPPLALLHCVSSYPAAARDANLRAIETMRRAFGVPVGWSDHTPGTELAVAATAAGASVIEKHLTLDRSRSGPDHRSSLEPAAFGAMVAAVRAAEAAMGDGVKLPVPDEADVAKVARRSLHWARALEAGAPIGPDDVAILRPADGLAPGRVAEVIGHRTSRAVHPGRAVEATDVEGLS